MVKNFIFDVDQTLVDSAKAELTTLKQALFIVTNQSFSDEVMNKITTMTTSDFFESLGIDTTSDTMKMINRHWGRLLKENRIAFFTGMKEVLVEIKNKEHFLGIVTQRTKTELEELDCLMDILDMFDIIVTSDLITNPKPDPEALNVILEEFSLLPHETVYIGDGANDLKASRAANIKFGFAAWGTTHELEGDFILKTPQSLYKLI